MKNIILGPYKHLFEEAPQPQTANLVRAQTEKEKNIPAKVEDIVLALKKDHPNWSKEKIYAIAWSTFNKMGEAIQESFINSLQSAPSPMERVIKVDVNEDIGFVRLVFESGKTLVCHIDSIGPKTNSVAESKTMYVALTDDGSVIGASDDKSAASLRYWNGMEKDIAKIAVLKNVPDNIAQKLEDHGTPDQEFRDGYEAWSKSSRFFKGYVYEDSFGSYPNLHKDIEDFLSKNPEPSDEEVHGLAAELGVSVEELESQIYKMLSDELRLGEAMSDDIIYKVITKRDGVEYFKSEKDLLKRFTKTGANTNRSNRKEIIGQPILKGLHGPSYGGIEKNKTVIRYEDHETYSSLSEAEEFYNQKKIESLMKKYDELIVRANVPGQRSEYFIIQRVKSKGVFAIPEDWKPNDKIPFIEYSRFVELLDDDWRTIKESKDVFESLLLEYEQGDVEDLELYIDNTGKIYREQYLPILKKLSDFMKKGTYKQDGAIKLFVTMIKRAIEMYNKEMEDKKSWTSSQINDLAKTYAKEFEAIYKNREYDFMK